MNENIKTTKEYDVENCPIRIIAKNNANNIECLTEKVENLEKNKENSNMTIALMSQKLDTFINMQKEAMMKLNIKIDELMGKPAKRWDAIVGAGIGGLVIYLITQALG